MKPESKIYVAGHRGLVGSGLVRTLQRKGYRNLVPRATAASPQEAPGMSRGLILQ